MCVKNMFGPKLTQLLRIRGVNPRPTVLCKERHVESRAGNSDGSVTRQCLWFVVSSHRDGQLHSKEESIRPLGDGRPLCG